MTETRSCFPCTYFSLWKSDVQCLCSRIC